MLYQIEGTSQWFSYKDPAELVDHPAYGSAQAVCHLAPGTIPEQARSIAELSTNCRAEQVSAPATSSESSKKVGASVTSSELRKMRAQEDHGIPSVKFPPKPEGWKGDPGNPNFKALGTLSPPVMMKIEPAGPHFLAFARRVSLSTKFSLHAYYTPHCILTTFRSAMVALSPRMTAFKHRTRSRRSKMMSPPKSASLKTHSCLPATPKIGRFVAIMSFSFCSLTSY